MTHRSSLLYIIMLPDNIAAVGKYLYRYVGRYNKNYISKKKKKLFDRLSTDFLENIKFFFPLPLDIWYCTLRSNNAIDLSKKKKIDEPIWMSFFVDISYDGCLLASSRLAWYLSRRIWLHWKRAAVNDPLCFCFSSFFFFLSFAVGPCVSR